MKLHEIKSQVSAVTGLNAIECDGGVDVLVTGDHPEMVPAVREKLESAGIPFVKLGARKFRGARFFVPLANRRTAFHAEWEYAG